MNESVLKWVDKAFPKTLSIQLIIPDIFGAVGGLLKSRNRESLVLVVTDFSLSLMYGEI